MAYSDILNCRYYFNQKTSKKNGRPHSMAGMNGGSYLLASFALRNTFLIRHDMSFKICCILSYIKNISTICVCELELILFLSRLLDRFFFLGHRYHCIFSLLFLFSCLSLYLEVHWQQIVGKYASDIICLWFVS